MFTAIGHIFSFLATIFSAADKAAQALDIHAGVLVITAEDTAAKQLRKRGDADAIKATRQVLVDAGVLPNVDA